MDPPGQNICQYYGVAKAYMGSVSSVPGEGAAKPGLVGTGAPDALSSFLRDFFLAGHQAGP